MSDYRPDEQALIPELLHHPHWMSAPQWAKEIYRGLHRIEHQLERLHKQGERIMSQGQSQSDLVNAVLDKVNAKLDAIGGELSNLRAGGSLDQSTLDRLQGLATRIDADEVGDNVVGAPSSPTPPPDAGPVPSPDNNPAPAPGTDTGSPLR